MSPRPLGVVLAGGPGSRLGGRKPWRTVGGRRLIDLALEALAPHTDGLMVVTNRVADFADLTCTVVADRWPGQGPLAALATAFLESRAPSLVLAPVDNPFLSPALVARLAAGQPGSRALVTEGPRGWEPLLSWYSRDCLQAALRLIAKDERRLRRLLKMVDATSLPWEEVRALDPEGRSLFNINYPEDLVLARSLADEAWAD